MMQEERRGRLLLLDLARSLALLGMVIFHLTYDLGLFGWIAPETAFTGIFWYLARATAGSFLFLAGLGLYLSHGRGIRWRAFWQRLLKIAAAAALVSVGTYLAMPEMWIFYGILHAIALSSLVGLVFLRLPIWALLGLGAGVIALPYHWSLPNLPDAFVWTGLTGRIPLTADFEPFFPWFGPFLFGMAAAKVFEEYRLWQRLEPRATPLMQKLAWPGQHSLVLYLIHQPVLMGILMALGMLFRG